MLQKHMLEHGRVNLKSNFKRYKEQLEHVQFNHLCVFVFGV